MSDHTQSSAKQSDPKSEKLKYVIRRGDDLIVHLTYDVPFKHSPYRARDVKGLNPLPSRP